MASTPVRRLPGLRPHRQEPWAERAGTEVNLRLSCVDICELSSPKRRKRRLQRRQRHSLLSRFILIMAPLSLKQKIKTFLFFDALPKERAYPFIRGQVPINSSLTFCKQECLDSIFFFAECGQCF